MQSCSIPLVSSTVVPLCFPAFTFSAHSAVSSLLVGLQQPTGSTTSVYDLPFLFVQQTKQAMTSSRMPINSRRMADTAATGMMMMMGRYETAEVGARKVRSDNEVLYIGLEGVMDESACYDRRRSTAAAHVHGGWEDQGVIT